MPSPLTARAARILASAGLVGALMIPAAAPVAAADPVVLNIGDTQGIDSINPYGTALVVGYEAFGLTYDLLVGFGPEAEPAPGFAESWERAADGKSWTFKIREGMKWSDGDAGDRAGCLLLVPDQPRRDRRRSRTSASATSTRASATPASPRPSARTTTTMILTSSDPSDRILQTYVPILPKHIWGDKTYAEIGEADVRPRRRSAPARTS